MATDSFNVADASTSRIAPKSASVKIGRITRWLAKWLQPVRMERRSQRPAKAVPSSSPFRAATFSILERAYSGEEGVICRSSSCSVYYCRMEDLNQRF